VRRARWQHLLPLVTMLVIFLRLRPGAVSVLSLGLLLICLLPHHLGPLRHGRHPAEPTAVEGRAGSSQTGGSTL
jgi:hypothetical protein